MQKICLDTSICIDLIKTGNKGALSSFLTAEAFLSSMALFELRLRTHNLEEAELFISTFEILAFDKEAAEEASNIEKDWPMKLIWKKERESVLF